MTNRVLIRIGPILGSVLIALLLAGATLYAAEAAAPVDCSACHDTGLKLAKSAHAGLPCETCHENYVAATHPAGITKPDVRLLPRGAGRRLRPGRAWPGPQERQ